MSKDREVPVALTVAGFDGSAGAGVLADCRTFERLGVYGIAAPTALTVQRPGKFLSLNPVNERQLADQLALYGASYPIAAIKIGMMGAIEIVQCVAEWLQSWDMDGEVPIVIDPVARATAGDEPLAGHTVYRALADQLFPRAALITPNLSEAIAMSELCGCAVSTGVAGISSVAAQQELAEALADTIGVPILVKGGHMEARGGEICDVLRSPGGAGQVYRAERLEVPDLHGTGCTLSAAIAAYLARGYEIKEAVHHARQDLLRWMQEHHRWREPAAVDALNATSR